jgi:hypothetical protein
MNRNGGMEMGSGELYRDSIALRGNAIVELISLGAVEAVSSRDDDQPPLR